MFNRIDPLQLPKQMDFWKLFKSCKCRRIPKNLQYFVSPKVGWGGVKSRLEIFQKIIRFGSRWNLSGTIFLIWNEVWLHILKGSSNIYQMLTISNRQFWSNHLSSIVCQNAGYYALFGPITFSCWQKRIRSITSLKQYFPGVVGRCFAVYVGWQMSSQCLLLLLLICIWVL